MIEPFSGGVGGSKFQPSVPTPTFPLALTGDQAALPSTGTYTVMGHRCRSVIRCRSVGVEISCDPTECSDMKRRGSLASNRVRTSRTPPPPILLPYSLSTPADTLVTPAVLSEGPLDSSFTTPTLVSLGLETSSIRGGPRRVAGY
eukprot:766259-Hanusia_phi.AAC.7